MYEMKFRPLLAVVFFFTAFSHGYDTCPDGLNQSSTPASSFFMFEEKGVVVDPKTQLMWKRCFEGSSGNDCAIDESAPTGVVTIGDIPGNQQAVDEYLATFNFTFKEALTRASAASFSGYSDWRVPNIKELASIVDVNCSWNALYEKNSIFYDDYLKGETVRAVWNAGLFPSVKGETENPYWSSTPVANTDNSGSVTEGVFSFGYVENPPLIQGREIETRLKVRLVRDTTPEDSEFQPNFINN